MPGANETEEGLRKALAEALELPGDEPAKFHPVLERMFAAYKEDVYVLARRRVPEARVDEVFAATWDAVPRALATFRGDSSFKTFLLRIAEYKAKDILRGGHDREREALSNVISTVFMQAPSHQRPSRELARAELEHLVRKMIDELEPDDRELLVLHYREGKKAVDIARERGLAPNTVAQRIVRARDRLQKALAALGIKEP